MTVHIRYAAGSRSAAGFFRGARTRDRVFCLKRFVIGEVALMPPFVNWLVEIKVWKAG
jgi:hypothetical protein